MKCAVLNGCNLLGADLSKADLSGADLREADLIGVELLGADLEKFTQKLDMRHSEDLPGSPVCIGGHGARCRGAKVLVT